MTRGKKSQKTSPLRCMSWFSLLLFAQFSFEILDQVFGVILEELMPLKDKGFGGCFVIGAFEAFELFGRPVDNGHSFPVFTCERANRVKCCSEGQRVEIAARPKTL